MDNQLIGKHIKIITDGSPELDSIAKIVMVDTVKHQLLLELDNPLTEFNKTYKYLVGVRRLVDGNVQDLSNKGSFWCGLTWIPNEKFNPQNPYDTSWWRGGPASNATLELMD